MQLEAAWSLLTTWILAVPAVNGLLTPHGCEPGPDGKTCYFIVNAAHNQSEAGHACAAHSAGSHLAAVVDRRALSHVTYLMTSHHAGTAWVGGQYDVPESDQGIRTVNDVECGFMSMLSAKSAEWRRISCSKRRRFRCLYVPDGGSLGTCRYDFAKCGKYCIRHMNAMFQAPEADWYQAAQYCLSMSSELPPARSHTDAQDWVRQSGLCNITSPSQARFFDSWTNFTNLHWHWTTGEEMRYTKWLPDSPQPQKGRCVKMSVGTHLMDIGLESENCSMTLPAVCQTAAVTGSQAVFPDMWHQAYPHHHHHHAHRRAPDEPRDPPRDPPPPNQMTGTGQVTAPRSPMPPGKGQETGSITAQPGSVVAGGGSGGYGNGYGRTMRPNQRTSPRPSPSTTTSPPIPPPRPIPPPTQPPTLPPTLPPIPPPSPPMQWSHALVVGLVTGGVVSLLLIGVVVASLCCCCRRKLPGCKPEKLQEAAPVQSPETQSGRPNYRTMAGTTNAGLETGESYTELTPGRPSEGDTGSHLYTTLQHRPSSPENKYYEISPEDVRSYTGGDYSNPPRRPPPQRPPSLPMRDRHRPIIPDGQSEQPMGVERTRSDFGNGSSHVTGSDEDQWEYLEVIAPPYEERPSRQPSSVSQKSKDSGIDLK